MDDLITSLTAAIDEREASAEHIHRSDCDSNSDQSVSYKCDCDQPGEVRRGCAGDRKILALHQPIETFAGSTEFRPKHAGTSEFPIKVICELCADHDRENGWDDHDEDVQYPCPTLRAVAGRYGLEDTRG